jgi:Fic family protein
MLFKTPELPPQYLDVIKRIEELRKQLRFATSDSLNRWTGFLARMTLARAIHGSNTMEGINVTLDDAVAAVDRESPLRPQDEDWHALVGYREALDYIIQLSQEPNFNIFNEGTILGLHYMMMKYDLTKNPGRMRPGPIHVTNTATNQIVYHGPDVELVPRLMSELITALNAKDGHFLVRAAMAHLNLTMIHPFRDGNGRMARALQTMVLAREKVLSPIFSSIEEYVGRNTADYYAVLAEVGQGSWHPERDALPWIKFCLTAHYRQATTLLRRIEEMGRLVAALTVEVKSRKFNERVLNALIDAAINLKVSNPTYRKQANVSNQVGKIDLINLAEAGLLEKKGEKRGRYYVASAELKAVREGIRLEHKQEDPFAEPERQTELPLTR